MDFFLILYKHVLTDISAYCNKQEIICTISLFSNAHQEISKLLLGSRMIKILFMFLILKL